MMAFVMRICCYQNPPRTLGGARRENELGVLKGNYVPLDVNIFIKLFLLKILLF